MRQTYSACLGVGVGSLRHTRGHHKRALIGRRDAQQFALVSYPQRASRNLGEVVLRMRPRLDVNMYSKWIPNGFHVDGIKSSDSAVEPRQRTGETETMTVNVGVVDLGQVDLLVQEGFYSNRSDLIRTALRNQLALHADTVKQTVARRTLTVGLQHFGRADQEKVVAAGQRLQVQVVGLARIAGDVTPELAHAAIESVSVLGAFQTSPAVRRALSDRIQ